MIVLSMAANNFIFWFSLTFDDQKPNNFRSTSKKYMEMTVRFGHFLYVIHSWAVYDDSLAANNHTLHFLPMDSSLNE